ncbi:hypothetical protein [Microvirga massiliensis]|uniref:hypothetical protein n=1 Tax=Microvirga massiliensis TaxID=1033741 RepID=UPI00062B5FA3|nr:hypothetical protein [Microvirga massiliensis]
MAAGKGGGQPGIYQVHDPATGLFMKVDSRLQRVIAVKSTPGPFQSIRILEAVEEAARESFLTASDIAANWQAEREAAEKAAATPTAEPATEMPAAAQSAVKPAAKKAAAKEPAKKPAAKQPKSGTKEVPKRGRGRPPSKRAAKGTSSTQLSAKEFSRRALEARAAAAASNR